MTSFSLFTLSAVCLFVALAGGAVATDCKSGSTKEIRTATAWLSLVLIALSTVGFVSWVQQL